MTRKQAEKVVARIVAAAMRKAGTNNWTTVDVQLDPADISAIEGNFALIFGTLPIGWRIAGRRGHETITVVRPDRPTTPTQES